MHLIKDMCLPYSGKISWVQFLRFSRISYYPQKLDPRNKHDCIVYEHERARPRKLNRENFEDWPSAKIGPHENFPLYGIWHITTPTNVWARDGCEARSH